MNRYLALDQADGIAASHGVTGNAAYKHCESWCEAFAPAYQKPSHERVREVQIAWWAFARKHGLAEQSSWPESLGTHVPDVYEHAVRRVPAPQSVVDSVDAAMRRPHQPISPSTDEPPSRSTETSPG